MKDPAVHAAMMKAGAQLKHAFQQANVSEPVVHIAFTDRHDATAFLRRMGADAETEFQLYGITYRISGLVK